MSLATEVAVVERITCMDERDVECSHCGGLTAHRSCDGQSKTHCAHCGNMLGEGCKVHMPDKKADAPRVAVSKETP